MTDDFTYRDANGFVVGPGALSDHIGEVQAETSGAPLTLASGNVVDVADDGRLASVLGFLDM